MNYSVLEWANLTQITIISTAVGKNSFEEVNEIVQNAVLGFSLKNDRLISVHFQGKPCSITVIQGYDPLMLKKLKLNGPMKTYKTFEN